MKSEEELVALATKMAAGSAKQQNLNEQQMNDSVHGLIIAFLKTDKVKQFRQLTSVEERIRFMYKHEAYWPLLQGIRHGGSVGKGEKDEVYSRQMRDAGNSAFLAKNDEEALNCYNQALLAAPADPWDSQGEDLALALANRSALMLRQGNTAQGLKDTTLALKSGYPAHLQYKLLQRHAKCLCELGRFDEAKSFFREALNSLKNSKLNKDQKKIVEKEVKSAIDAINIKDGLESALNLNKERKEGEDEEDDIKKPRTAAEAECPNFPRNPKFPALHKSITIKYDHARGRHAIATESIKCGTYLAFEKPILSFLWAEEILTHCTACLRPVSAPVPCYTCSLVVFCSGECRRSAWEKFHQYECKALEAITSMYQNIFVAYRAIAQKPLKYFLSHKHLFSKYDYHRGGGCYDYQYESDSDSGDTEPESEDESHELESPYRSSDYENLYNLVTHSSQMSDADLLAYSTSTCLLLYYLRISNYFGSQASRDSDRELSAPELYIGGLLYHILEVLQFNTHTVAEAKKWEEDKGVEIGTIGCAINPTLALFNHSCTPNTTRANVGHATLVVATADIKKGEEISDSYSMLFQDKLLTMRQNWLAEHYRFTCNCTACANKWPIHEFMTKTSVIEGGNPKALHYIKKMFSTISKLSSADLSVGHYDRVHQMWSNYYSELNAVVEKPNKSFLKIASRLQDILWLKWGSRGLSLQAPAFRDHRINQRRSSSNMSIPQLIQAEEKQESNQ